MSRPACPDVVAQRQAIERIPQPRALLAAAEVVDLDLRVHGYNVIPILIVSDVAGTLEIFERVEEDAGLPIGTFVRLFTFPSVAGVDEEGNAVQFICRRHFPCGDIGLFRFTNGGADQAFFNVSIKGQPI